MSQLQVRVAISGASGFLGRHVVRQACTRDNLVPVALTRRNPVRVESGRNVQEVPCDLHAPCVGLFDRLGQPDVLIHLAWGGLPHYRSLHHFSQELPAQFRWLQAMVTQGLKRVVVAGTCLEYGLLGGELTEASPAEPVTAYGVAKDGLRRQLEMLRQATPFGLTWARLFYMYGEGQARTSLFPQLQQTLATGAPTFAMSAGEQVRDFLPVQEVARTLVDLALNEETAGIVNLCSGKPVSVRSQVEQWIAAHPGGHRPRLELGAYPYPDYEPMAFWGSRAKLDLHLGRSA